MKKDVTYTLNDLIDDAMKIQNENIVESKKFNDYVPDKNISDLIPYLNSDNSYIVKKVIEELDNSGDPIAIPALISFIDSTKDYDLKSMALYSLIKFNDLGIEDCLIKNIVSHEWSFRLVALDGLYKIGSIKAVIFLSEHLCRKRKLTLKGINNRIFRVISEFYIKKIIKKMPISLFEILKEKIENVDIHDTGGICYALALSGDVNAIPIIKTIFNKVNNILNNISRENEMTLTDEYNSCVELRTIVSASLAYLGDKSGIRYLHDKLNETAIKDPYLLLEVINALVRLQDESIIYYLKNINKPYHLTSDPIINEEYSCLIIQSINELNINESQN